MNFIIIESLQATYLIYLGAELKNLKYDYFVFTFMEENIKGVIANEYEYPWVSLATFLRSLRVMDGLRLKKA